MATIFFLFLMIVIVALATGVSAMLNETYLKAATWLATVVIVVFVGLLFLDSSKAPEQGVKALAPTTPSTSTSSISSPSQPRTVTLENYRYKGDSVKIECADVNGKAVCKSAR